ncbi:hypothetical protein AMTRI_Chr04g179950 [Amborella trichopoda]
MENVYHEILSSSFFHLCFFAACGKKKTKIGI